MRVTINGVLLQDTVTVDMGPHVPALQLDREEYTALEKAIGHLKRNKPAYTAAVTALAVLTFPGIEAFAASQGPNVNEGGVALIKLLQKGALWCAIVVGIWGIAEMWIDAPGWTWRILKGFVGYVGILILPLIFFSLEDALIIDGWVNFDNYQLDQPTNQPAPPVQQPVWQPTEQEAVNGVGR